MGRLAESLAFAERLSELAAADRTLGIPSLGFSTYVWSLQMGAEIKLEMGRLDEARRDLVHVVEVARETGEPEVLGWALHNWSYLEILTGASEKAPGYAAECLQIAEKLGSTFSQVHALGGMAHAQSEQSLWKDAIASLRRALDLAREHRTAREAEAGLLVRLADAYRGDGQLERARETIAEALAVAEERGARFAELEGNLVLARVLVDADNAAAEAAVTEALDRARDRVEEFGARAYAPVVLVERARLASLLRDEDSRAVHLREAHRLYTEMGATGHAERLARELGL
jgi:tetratricopeptide (TPR) repeat protein